MHTRICSQVPFKSCSLFGADLIALGEGNITTLGSEIFRLLSEPRSCLPPADQTYRAIAACLCVRYRPLGSFRGEGRGFFISMMLSRDLLLQLSLQLRLSLSTRANAVCFSKQLSHYKCVPLGLLQLSKLEETITFCLVRATNLPLQI